MLQLGILFDCNITMSNQPVNFDEKVKAIFGDDLDDLKDVIASIKEQYGETQHALEELKLLYMTYEDLDKEDRPEGNSDIYGESTNI